MSYAIRLPANDVLERAIEDLLTRPRGRPSHAPLVRYRSFSYQAASWDRARRVIAKIEHHLGELFPRVGFIVTTLTGTSRAVAFPVTGSERTRSVCSSASSPTTSATCCGDWSCPSPSGVGHSRACNGACSRPADASSDTPGTSSCSWPKAN